MAQVEYCRNFIFKRHFAIHKIFERSCEIGLWRLTAVAATGLGLFHLRQGLPEDPPRILT